MFQLQSFNIEVPDTEKFAIVERVASIIGDQGLPLTTIDGVRVDLDSGWGLIRSSNTTPNLVYALRRNRPKR